MLKLKLQYFGHLMWRTNSLEKTLILGKIEGWRRRDDRGWNGWMASLTLWTWIWVRSRSWWQTRKPTMLQSMGSQGVGHDWVTELNIFLKDANIKKIIAFHSLLMKNVFVKQPPFYLPLLIKMCRFIFMKCFSNSKAVCQLWYYGKK